MRNSESNIIFGAVPSWMTITTHSESGDAQTTGRGDGSFTISVTENDTGEDRTATITVSSTEPGVESKTISFVQYKRGSTVKYLNIDVDSLSFEYDETAARKRVNVTSNTLWIVSSDESWCVPSSMQGLNDGYFTVRVTQNDGSQRTATITVKTDDNSITRTIEITQRQEEQPSVESYTVGLISDIHYCVTTNKKIITESEGNTPDEYGSASFFREDLNKLINEFNDAGVDFVASCGDIVTYDVNDLVEFTHDYIKDWTGIDTYSGTSFQNNANFKPFYCTIGNHDHWTIYSDAAHCKYINYGNSSDHNGSRWKTITYNGTTYNCPEQLVTGNITYANSSSKSYYVIPSGHPNDMFIFLSAYYGSRLPDESNPNYGDRNDMSQLHPHNQLDKNDSNVQAMMQYCGKTSIFDSGNETNMNFQYYKPSDLIWLKDTIEANSSKRIFVFSHYFFPHKAGGGNKYEVGSTELNGLTFHFLNKLNNYYPRTIWFSGHSHFSWKDLTYNNTGDIHFCSKDYQYIEPDATDNAQILTNFNNSNYYEAPSKRKLYNRFEPQTVIDNTTAWNVHLPSMSRPKESSSVMANCEAAIMEVHNDHVVISKIGYSTSDGINYNSYTNDIYYHSLTVQSSDGSGTISGPTPGGGGDAPEPGINRDIYMYISLTNTGAAVALNSHVRLQFEDGTYLHFYRSGSAEKNSDYYGKLNKYTVISGWTFSNELMFVNSIPDKYRYLCHGSSLYESKTDPPSIPEDAYISDFFEYYYDLSETKMSYKGDNGWVMGSDKTELVNSLKNVLDNYQGRKLKSEVLIYYYDSNNNEQSYTGTLTDVCYYNSKTEIDYESLGLYFVNGFGITSSESKKGVKYKITFSS